MGIVNNGVAGGEAWRTVGMFEINFILHCIGAMAKRFGPQILFGFRNAVELVAHCTFLSSKLMN